MNANELADSLEAASSDMEYNYHVSDWKLLYECALVMRKQQAEIGFYKQDADKYKQKCASQQAEIEALKGGFFDWSGFKKLTDEEIKALWKPMPDTKTYESDVLKFARAILRKAQEKC